MKDTKLQELSESIAKLKESIGASISAMPENEHKDVMDSVFRMVGNIYDYVDSIANRLYEHTSASSHIPPISGPAQMNKVLKALSMNDDYKCEPRTIFASRNNVIIEAEYKKPKE